MNPAPHSTLSIALSTSTFFSFFHQVQPNSSLLQHCHTLHSHGQIQVLWALKLKYPGVFRRMRFVFKKTTSAKWLKLLPGPWRGCVRQSQEHHFQELPETSSSTYSSCLGHSLFFGGTCLASQASIQRCPPSETPSPPPLPCYILYSPLSITDMIFIFYMIFFNISSIYFIYLFLSTFSTRMSAPKRLCPFQQCMVPGAFAKELCSKKISYIIKQA